MNQHGASRSIVVRLSASTLAVVALLGLTWFCAAVSADRLRASYAHTVNTIDALSGVVLQGTKLRDDEETGLRGYLLTGRQRFLQPYDVARRALPALRQRQDLLTAAEPAALPLVRAEWRAGDAWDRWATDVLVHPLPAPRGAAALIAQQDHGKVLFDRYRAAANRIIARLDGARQEDLRASVATSVMTDRLFAALFASAISLGLLLGWRAMRAVTRPLAALRRAAGAIGHGDLTQPVAIAGAREFVRLGAEMDAMRRQLQARADELAASEARFRALAEHGSDLVCVLAPDGGALYGSPSYARILGASIEDLHQAAGGPLAAIHPDDRAHVHAAMAACVTEGRPSVTLTCRHRHADGSWRTLECVATNRLTDPAVRGVIVTSRDVTARVEAEERLRASEERLRTLITHLPVILFALDADGVFTFSDGAGLATVGVAPDQVVGRPYRDVHAAHPEILEHLGRALVGEEVAFLRRVGERILDARATPLRDARGGVTGVFGVCVDVTDRLRAEEALRASEERRRVTIADAPIVLTTIDATGVVTLCEGRGLATMGRAPNETVGRSMFEIFRDAPAILAALRGALAGEETTSVATVRGRVFETHYSPARDVGGVVREVVAVATDVSDRVRAEEALRAEEEALRAEEERYRAVAEAAHDAIIASDSAGRIISWNKGAEAIFGYTLCEAIGQPLTLLMPEEYRAAHQSGLERLARGEAPHSLGQTLELQGQRKDGSAFPIELSLSSWETIEGAFYGGIIRDVSARRAMEAALDQERTILRADAERLSGVIAIQQEVALADLDTRVVLPLIAARAQELSDADGAVVELVEGEDMVYHAVTGTLEGYEGTRLPLIGTLTGLCVRTGETLYCADAAIDPRTDPVICRRLGIGSMVVVPLRHGGAVVGALKVSATATHAFDARAVQTLQLMAGVLGAALGQAAAFDALRVSEERLRTVVANAPLILFTIDPDGVYTMSDGAGLAALGREPGAVVGRSVFDVYRDQPALLDDTRRALAGTPVTFPSQVHGAVFDNHLTPLHDAQGRLISVIGVSTNITERARAEAALVENRRELERSNAELQQFAYVASHDLQEPLRTITSYLTLLQRRYQGKLGADADEFIGFATDGAQRMSALIKAVLAYSRVGTHGAAFGPTDCGGLVAAAVANLDARIAESDARVVYDALPAVHGDAAQLGQLFQNLIGNALKFTRPDVAPLVRVEAERQGDRWLVRVVDNGIGIAPAHTARIFQMFGRLHTRTEYEGTGIGLAVCQRIVERHGGRIWVESQPGQGAAFLFTLPALDDCTDRGTDKGERDMRDAREDAAA